jgi:RNA-directed DNA polymerase
MKIVFFTGTRTAKPEDTAKHNTKATMRLPIEKRQVWQAYQHVRLNDGTHGVDQQSWELFDRKRYHNLYIIWNRLSSGAYFPKPVRRVLIPKSNGAGERPLGIPTVSDRIVQEVLRQILEPYLEPHFHVNSYAYRRGTNAHAALDACRNNTDYYSWCVDVDIKSYFDNIAHDKLMRAVVHYCPNLKWLHGYLWRILKAPVQLSDGSMQLSNKGVPQGGVISPLLSNLYLHVVFDGWIGNNVKAQHKFERYADDIIVHTVSEAAAKFILKRIGERFSQCGLALNEHKTKLVQTESYRVGIQDKTYVQSFDFLGHQFKKCWLRAKGSMKLLYTSRISCKSKQKMLQELKYAKLHKRTIGIEQLAQLLNEKVQGWISYYGKYGGSSMHYIYAQINRRLVKWCMWKYRKFKREAIGWLYQKWAEKPMLFAHWQQTKWFCYYNRNARKQVKHITEEPCDGRLSSTVL